MPQAGPPPWRNWAGTVTATHHRREHPRSVADVADAVTRASRDGLPVKALGSGHSFSPVGATSGVALDLSGWHGVSAADAETGLVTVRSGTTLRELNTTLDALGLAMTNLGDIDVQTLAGAIATGTHGTGAAFGGLPTQVEALQMVLADGSVVHCSPRERPDLFAAARVGLGALGVVTSVTLRCEPAFTVHAREHPMPLARVLDGPSELLGGDDHVEFYWFPYGDNALVKQNTRLPAGTSPQPLSRVRHLVEYELLENQAFGLLCRLGRAAPALVRPLNRLASATLSSRTYSDRSHRVFTTSRRVRFVESEYAVPRAALPDVLGALRQAVARLAHPVMFPVEVRVAAADDVWLSTAYGRDTAYVAVHQFVGLPYQEYFEVFESVAASAGGRPHWGKLHTMDAADLRARYPRFDDFRRVRDHVDPAGRFRNPYLDRVLGHGSA